MRVPYDSRDLVRADCLAAANLNPSHPRGRVADNPERLACAVHLAKMLKGMRRLRNEAYPSDLFGEPAWDMLLSLFLARCDQYRLKVSTLAFESNVPQTTALRWISELIERGLARKIASPTDLRTHFVEMTESAFDQMATLLDDIWSHDWN